MSRSKESPQFLEAGKGIICKKCFYGVENTNPETGEASTICSISEVGIIMKYKNGFEDCNYLMGKIRARVYGLPSMSLKVITSSIQE